MRESLLSYLLPGNFHAKAWADFDGGVRVSIDRELMLTPRLGVFGELEYDSHEDWSYQGGASYLINQTVSVTALWDSKYGGGSGADNSILKNPLTLYLTTGFRVLP